MDADCEAVTVDLISMQQPRLHHALAATDLVEQPMHVGDEIIVDVGEMGSDHGSEQQPTETGRRIHG
jgi:hypothetical protein